MAADLLTLLIGVVQPPAFVQGFAPSLAFNDGLTLAGTRARETAELMGFTPLPGRWRVGPGELEALA